MHASFLLFLQPEGVSKILPIGTITDREKALIKAAIPELTTNIQTVCCFFQLSTPTSPNPLDAQGVTYVADAYKAEDETPKL